MNSGNIIFANLWRFLGLVAVQALVLKQLSTAVGSYFNVLLYPLFILLLPMKTPSSLASILGFAIGVAIDFIYQTPGLHASAGAFSGFARGFVLSVFAPRGGYSGKEPIPAPAYFGWQYFIPMSTVFFLLHLFWYFSVDSFTFVYAITIGAKTLAALLLTMIFVVLYAVMFNPKD